MADDTKTKVIDKLLSGGVASAVLILFGWWFSVKVAEPVIDSHTEFLREQVKIGHDHTKILESVDETLREQKKWYDAQKK